jgi:hypothetical protein
VPEADLVINAKKQQLSTDGIGFARDLCNIYNIMNLHDDVQPSSIYNGRTNILNKILSANYKCDIGENGQKFTSSFNEERPRPSVSLYRKI